MAVTTEELSHWNLTTPEVDVDGYSVTYWPEDFPDNEYFHINASSNLELWAPTKGATTANSSRTRTEFREIVSDPNSHTQMNWTPSTFAHNFLRCAMTVNQVPANGVTCIGQVHVKDEDPMFKLLWSNGNLRGSFRETFGQANPVNNTIIPGVELGSRVNYSIRVSSNNTISVNISVNGGPTVNQQYTFDSSWADKLLYFKAGVYNQETATETTPLTEGSRVVIDKLQTEHY